MNATTANYVIAVVGGSGAGKTWLVERLCRALGDRAGRLSLDDFYRDQSHLPLNRRAQVNFDVPDAIDWERAERVVRDLRFGAPARVPRYDFATHSRASTAELHLPRPVVIVEGLWWLRRPTLRRLFDLTVYLDTPAPVRLARRLARDTVERGYTAEAVEQRLTADVLPMHARHVEPQKRLADVVLAQPFTAEAITRFADRCWEGLAASGALPRWSHESFQSELLSLLVEHEYCT